MNVDADEIWFERAYLTDYDSPTIREMTEWLENHKIDYSRYIIFFPSREQRSIFLLKFSGKIFRTTILP